MWGQLLTGVLKAMAASGGDAAQGGQQSLPGQEAAPDATGMTNTIMQGQPQGIALAQQQNAMQPRRSVSGMPAFQEMPQEDQSVLPPLAGPDGVNMGNMTPMGGDPGMQDPLTWQNPGVQSSPVGAQSAGFGGGQSVQPPRALDPKTGQPMTSPQASWGQLLNPMGGTRDNPNALVRMGEGYNSGGLVGALGYLLTDMSKKQSPNGF